MESVPSAAASDCPFCAIVACRAPARRVYETKLALAFFPDAPAVPGHTLVIPRAHSRDFLDAAPQDAAAVLDAATHVGRALASELKPQGMNLLTSAGAAASQTVFHLHLHVLPRWEGDALGDIWPEVRAAPAEELDRLAERLRQSLPG
jgi:histidine triad (HIT) family protein